MGDADDAPREGAVATAAGDVRFCLLDITLHTPGIGVEGLGTACKPSLQITIAVGFYEHAWVRLDVALHERHFDTFSCVDLRTTCHDAGQKGQIVGGLLGNRFDAIDGLECHCFGLARVGRVGEPRPARLGEVQFDGLVGDAVFLVLHARRDKAVGHTVVVGTELDVESFFQTQGELRIFRVEGGLAIEG